MITLEAIDPLDWSAPCCPSCGVTGEVFEMAISDGWATTPALGMVTLSVWTHGASHGADPGAWTLLCGDCDDEWQGAAEQPYPTLRSSTPPVVLAALGVKS